jgi:phosphoribosylanthranilate isomerase
VIKAFSATSPELRRADRYGTDLVLVDAPAPGSGKLFDWGLASDVPPSVRVILAGGLDPDNVADAIKVVEPWGVDVASGVEARPGVKDPTLVRRFIVNARAAAPQPYLGPDELPYDWDDE